MDMATPVAARTKPFRHPKRYFADVDPALAARMVSSGVDVALVLDGGIIKDVALGNPELVEAGCEKEWRGKFWPDIVTPDSHAKVADLIKASPENIGRWRQITQFGPSGAEIPIKFTTVKTGADGRVLALGQDLRSVATLQQRLIAMHQDLEREYASLRDIETRYRNLFNALSETVIIVAASDGTISEMNPAAQKRLGITDDAYRGRAFLDLIADGDRAAVQRMIDRTMVDGRGEAGEVSFKGRGSGAMHASAFREQSDVYLIVRIEGDTALPIAEPAPVPRSNIRQVMEHLPDGLVITTATFRVLSANATFLRMVQAVEDRQVIGEELSLWLGRSSAELNMLQSNLKRHGMARNFATVIRDSFGGEDEVEISAVAAELGSETVFGFAIRPISRRMPTKERGGDWLPGRPEEVTSLVGQMPLKDIVRTSTDLIEKLCIETALDLSDQSRASAAEILGLSRQGLYSKLKRFKIPQGD